MVFGCGNPTLLKQVGFRSLNNKIVHPLEPERNFWLFPYVPHWLKLFLNHCFDKGYAFQSKEGTSTQKTALSRSYCKRRSSNPPKSCHGINRMRSLQLMKLLPPAQGMVSSEEGLNDQVISVKTVCEYLQILLCLSIHL